MRILLFIMLFPAMLQAQFLAKKPGLISIGTYELTDTKVVGLSTIAIAAFTDGFLSRYEFRGRTFFDRWVDPYSYAGSMSWTRIYNGNDPANGPKSRLHYLVGAQDFWHHADKVRSYGMYAGAITIGIGTRSNKKIWHYAVDIGLSILVTSTSKHIGDRVGKL